MEENSAKLSPLKQAYVALERMQTKLDEMERTRTEPIAIIGIGCRFPGGVNDLESFWRILCEGVDAIVEIPPDRWNKDAFYSPDPQAPGKMSSKWGGFIKDIDKFDAQFFGIAPREAVEMDPQQRMMLEVAWEALENAGQAPDRLSGSETAVFAGMATYEYSDLKMGAANLINFNNYYISGCGPNMMSGRLSYILGLQGPSVTVDTACSSSLTAIHMACQSLRLRECSMAIASGVNAILQPHLMVAYSMAGLMAKDGRCKTFDAAADGLVRGEGCGVLVLKRLSDAIAAGDNIHAVIRGSAVNQDGPSSSLSAPNGPAQTSVIREALRRGTVDPLSVGYVEAHGTGTSLGDPIEVQALGEALSKSRSKSKPLYIGSVKTNFGHLEGAAGVVGLIKTVLAVQRGKIPASLNFRTPNPLIDWKAISVAVPTELMPWPSSGQARIAGVSAFGFGGTNVHVVLEQRPEQNARTGGVIPEFMGQETRPERPLHLFTLSAKHENTLRELAKRYESHLTDNPSMLLEDVCFTANAGRSHFDHRLATVVTSSKELVERLRGFAAQDPSEGVMHGRVDDAESPKIAFLFTGQSPQYAGMGKQLYETQPTFRKALERCQESLSTYLEKPLLSVLYPKSGEASSMKDPSYAHPALFALEYALTELWRSWGIVPSVIMGDGIGEYVAAHVAGVMGLDDSLKLVAERGRMFRTLPNENKSSKGDAFYNRACEVSFSSIRIPLISSILGKSVKDEMSKPGYWRDQTYLPVRLSDAMKTLRGQGCRIFVEVGPNPVFLEMRNLIAQKSDATWLPTLKNGEDDWESMLASLSALYVRGISIDWSGFDRDYRRKKTILPTYPFNKRSYWTPDRKDVIFNKLEAREHTFHSILGNRVHSPLFQDVVFEAQYNENNPPFIIDHRIYGKCLMPGAGYLAQALAAAEEFFGQGHHSIEQLLIHAAMVFVEGQNRLVQFVISQEGEGVGSFRIYSLADSEMTHHKEWTLHVTGTIRVDDTDLIGSREVFDQSSVQSRCEQEVDVRDHFLAMQRIGAELGPRFQGIKKLWHGRDECLARLVLPETFKEEARDYALYPGFIDAAIQVMGSALMSENAYPNVYMPVEVSRYRVYSSTGSVLWCHSVIHESGGGDVEAVVGDIMLYDETRKLVATLEGVQLKRTDVATFQRLLHRGVDDWLYELVWRPISNPKMSESSSVDGTGDWLIFGRSNGIREELAKHIRERGGHAILVSEGERFEPTDGNHWVINYDQKVDYFELFRHLDKPLRGVIFSGDCDSMDIMNVSTSRLEEKIQKSCGSVLYLVQAIISTIESDFPHLWILTRGTHMIAREDKICSLVGGALWGLGRVIALEHPEVSSVLIDLDTLESHNELGALFNELCLNDGEDQVAFRNNGRHVARLIRHDATRDRQADFKLTLPGESYQLEIVDRGLLDSLTLRPVPRQKPGPDEAEIRVHATALNFKDVLNALGMVGDNPFPFGHECAGTIVEVGKNVKDLKPGDEVIAYAPGSFRSYLTTSADFVIQKPDHISFEEAAGLLVVFHTAYATLHELGKMSRGDRVLIHAATGGVGMAALQLAQKAGAEVYATAGTERKRSFLRSLGVSHVMDSRSLDFADEIMKITRGEGVDIVLNSLAGEFIPKSMSVLRANGRFLEIGQRYRLDENQVAQLKEGVQYHLFDGTRLNRASVKSAVRKLRKLWVDGSLKPLPVKVFPIEQVISAFRYMSESKHIGKIVVTHKPMLTKAKSDCLRIDASYLITGGLGSLGLQIAHWMVEEGVRHLVLMGRSDPSQQAQQVISRLEQTGAEILVVRADVAREADVARTMEQIATSMPALRGVVHAAGVLDDGMLLQQDWERFAKVLAPKVSGAWNLHIATREMALDFFVLFSSTATIFPNYGQGNYTTANAFLDSLAHYRKAEGLPALSIDWGAWGGKGMAASVETRERLRWAEQGFSPMEPEDALEAFERVLAKQTAQVAVMPVDWSSFFRYQKGAQKPAMLSELADREVYRSRSVLTVSEKPAHYLEQFEQAAPEGRHDVLSDYMRKQVIKVLRLDPSFELRPTQGLAELGIDSLMAVELRNQIAKDFGVTLPAVTFLKGSSLSRISSMLLQKLTSTAAILNGPTPRSGEGIRPGLDGNSIGEGWEEGEL